MLGLHVLMYIIISIYTHTFGICSGANGCYMESQYMAPEYVQHDKIFAVCIYVNHTCIHAGTKTTLCLHQITIHCTLSSSMPIHEGIPNKNPGRAQSGQHWPNRVLAFCHPQWVCCIDLYFNELWLEVPSSIYCIYLSIYLSIYLDCASHHLCR